MCHDDLTAHVLMLGPAHHSLEVSPSVEVPHGEHVAVHDDASELEQDLDPGQVSQSEESISIY